MKRTLAIDDIRVITTTELSQRLGMQVSAKFLKKIGAPKPHVVTTTGIYWLEDDAPIIASYIAGYLNYQSIKMQQAKQSN